MRRNALGHTRLVASTLALGFVFPSDIQPQVKLKALCVCTRVPGKWRVAYLSWKPKS